MQFSKIFAAAGVTLLLAACGGGGSDSSSTQISSAAFPVRSAIAAFLTTSHQFNLSATDSASGDVYTLAYSYTPAGSGTFEGQAALTTNYAAVVKKNGVTAASVSGVAFAHPTFMYPLGNVNSSGEYTVYANQVPYPETAKVGDVGSVATGTEYTDSTKTSIVLTSTETFSIEPDTASSAFICNNETLREADSSTATGAECYKIDTSGDVIGAKFTIFVSGKSITFS